MIKIIKVSLFIVTLLLSNKVTSQLSNNIVEEFFRTTKIDSDFSQINTLIENKIIEKKKSIAENKYLKFSDILKKSFNSEKATSYLREYFLENEKEADLIKVMELYKNPLMIKMNNYEQDFYNPDKREEQMTFFKKMKTNPPKQERVNLLLSLNETLKASIKTKKLLENIVVAFSQGYNLTLPKNEQLDEEAVVSRAKLELPKEFSQQITNQFVAVGLYVYKDVSDIELKEYIEIWKTDIGKKYIDMIFSSYKTVFEKMSINLVKNLNSTF